MKFTNYRPWLFALALALLIAAVAIQTDYVQALQSHSNFDDNCMCGRRRGTPPENDPPNPPRAPSQPEPPASDEGPPPGSCEALGNCPAPPAPAPAPVATACVPVYNAPTMTMVGYDPDYPLVIGQDPDEKGVDVTIMAQGGAKANACPGDARGTIVTFQLREVNLSPEAIAWINGELRQAYPGAYVKDTYPLHPAPSVSLGSNATMTFHLDPLDPGAYIATVVAVQHDGQTISSDYRIPVHLLEATISW